MTNFNIKRFLQVLKYDLIQNKRMHLRYCAGIFAAFFLCIISLTYSASITDLGIIDETAGKMALGGAASLAAVIYCTLAVIGASLIFCNMNTKQQRISFLTLPATNLEKFAERWLTYTVLHTLAVSLIYIVADVTCYAVRALIGDGLGLTFPMMFSNMTQILLFKDYFSGGDIAWSSFDIKGFLFVSSILSTYLLGGTFFRRVPYVFTTLTCIGCGILFALVVATVAGTMAEHAESAESIFSWLDDHFNFFAWLLWAVPLLWIALCHWASYRMFCRSNVITHRTFGL